MTAQCFVILNEAKDLRTSQNPGTALNQSGSHDSCFLSWVPYRPRCARPLLHGPTGPIDGGLPARSTGAYRPVLAENSALCCFPGARTTENSALCCFPGARTTENSPLESFPGARCHCGGVPYPPLRGYFPTAVGKHKMRQPQFLFPVPCSLVPLVPGSWFPVPIA